jgi:hypothetical protein
MGKKILSSEIYSLKSAKNKTLCSSIHYLFLARKLRHRDIVPTRNDIWKISLNRQGFLQSFYLVGNGLLSPQVKRPGCEINHKLRSSAEVQEWLSYNFSFLFAFSVWTGRKLIVRYDTEGFWVFQFHMVLLLLTTFRGLWSASSSGQFRGVWYCYC